MNQDPYILANPPKREPVSDVRTYNLSIETKIDEALWNPNGAYSKPTAAGSPKGIPSELYIFKKGQEPKKE